MDNPEGKTAGPGGKPRPGVGYAKGLLAILGKAAMGGMQTAMIFAAAALFGGLLLVIVGKPIWMLLSWLWSVYLN